MNRRKLLFGSAATIAAFVKPAWSQALLNGGGKTIKNASGVVVTRPPAPTLPSAGAAIAFSLTNPVGQPTQTNPFFSFGFPFARGDFFDATQKLSAYDATGTVKIIDCQIDQISRGWHPDGSVNYCVVSGLMTGTTLAAGATANFTMRVVAGTAPTNPVCTLAQLVANSDLKAVCRIGTDTYTTSINTIATAYGAPSGSAHPQGMTYAWKTGPYAGEWTFGQYLKRDRDGASHMWHFLSLIITALSPTGPFLVRGHLENIQLLTANPAGTVGIHQNTTQPGIEYVDALDFYNGATRLWSQGGQNDTRVGTFSSTEVNLSTGEITPTYAANIHGGTANGVVTSSGLACYTPVGFYTTGTLPAGIGPAATTTYWVLQGSLATSCNPCLSRLWAQYAMSGVFKLVAGAPVSGTTYTVNKFFISGGARWFVSTAGVSSGKAPSGSGTTFADGTLIYTRFTAAITSGGTGTHTMAPKLYTTRANKTPIMADDSYPYSSTGTMPKLLTGIDFAYLTTKSMSLPPLKPSYVALPWQGPIPSFIPALPYLPGMVNFFYLGTQGGAVVDERINFVSPAGMACAYLPADQGMAISSRCIALSFLDRNNYYFRDERSQQVVVTNHGPDKIGGTYPSMGPTSPSIHPVALNGSNSIGYSADAVADWPGYGGGGTSQTNPEASHNANVFYWPYLSSGDPVFLQPMLEYASTFFASAGTAAEIKSSVVGGVQYDSAWPFFVQSRAAGHLLKIFSQAEWLCPSNHPAKQFLGDVMDDSANVGIPWMQANLTPLAQSLGIMPMVYPTWPAPQYPVNEVWMWTILQCPMTHEAWKNNRPGFKAFLENYFARSWCKLFDRDFGGSEKIIDVQYMIEGNAPTAGGSNTVIPPDSQLISDVATQILLCSGGAASGYQPFPAPGNFFTNGNQTQVSKTGPVYYTTTIPAGAFAGETYMALTMGSLAGMAQYTKLLGRVDALMTSAGTPFLYQATSTQLPIGNRNALMWMAAKS